MNLNAPRSYLAMILSHNWHYEIDRIFRFFCCSRSSELKIFLTPEAEKRSLSCLKFPCTLPLSQAFGDKTNIAGSSLHFRCRKTQIDE